MKKFTACLIIISVLLSLPGGFALADNGTNAVVETVFSENFEGDLSRWKMGKDGGGFLLNDTDDTEYIGRFAAVVTSDFSDDIPSIISIPFDVEGGETYTVAVDMRGLGSQKAYLQFLYEDGGRISYWSNNSFSNGTERDEWKCGYLTVDAPMDAKKAQIELVCDGNGGSSYYDNVIVCKGIVGFSSNFESRKKFSPIATENSNTEIEKINPVFYANFENPIGDWTHPDKRSETKVKRSSDRTYTGRKALIVDDDLGDKSVGIISPYFDISGGLEYEFGADIFKAIALTKSVTVTMTFYTSDDKKLGAHTLVSDKINWQHTSTTAIAPDDARKANITVTSSSGTGESFVDNIMVADTGNITLPEETKLDKINKSSIVLYIGSPNALVKGNKTLIDKENDKVIADTVNGRTLVPVRFIAENYGAEVGWDDATQTVTLNMPDKTVTIVLNENEIDIDGQKITIDVPVQTIQDRTMLPLRAFVEQVMGKIIFWDDRGLIVITDEAMLDASADKDTIDAIINNVK